MQINDIKIIPPVYPIDKCGGIDCRATQDVYDYIKYLETVIRELMPT